MRNGFRNRLLTGLRADELARIRSSVVKVSLKLHEVLYDRGEPIRYVHFVERGVVSITNRARPRSIVEVATVGNEGMIGLPVFLRGNSFLLTAFTQVAGNAWRMPAEQLVSLTQDHSGLRTNLSRYVQALLTQIAQSATCNRLHTLVERCARWILMTHDRVDADRFLLPQKFLAQMLGVPPGEEGPVAKNLESQKLIKYSKGMLRILDRDGLESASCECYVLVRREFERLGS